MTGVIPEFAPWVVGIRANGIVEFEAWEGGPKTAANVQAITRYQYRDVTLIIAGHCLLDAAGRSARLAAAVDDGETDAINTWPGSYSTVLIRDGSVTARADLAGQFPLYYARRGGEVLIGTDPRPLAAAHGREPDPLTAAAHIACSAVLPLWARRSAFTGVARLEGGEVLRAARGVLRVEQGRPPLPVHDRTLADGAGLLREALAAAVLGRCEGRAVSSDFSGGLDSTSVAFLAAASGCLPVTAVAYHQRLAPADDLAHAVACAELDGRIDLTVVHGDLAALPFAGPPPGTSLGAEPHPGSLARARSAARLAVTARSGASLHLTGEGGDAVLLAAPSYLASLARAGRAGMLLRHAAAYARLRQEAPAVLAWRAVRLAATSPRRALTRLAAELAEAPMSAAPGPGAVPGTRWSDNVAWWPSHGQALSWLRPAIRGQLAEIAADPATAAVVPAGAGPADLAALADLRRSADAQRQFREVARSLGVVAHAPFLDDAVIRAALSVPAHLRAHPQAYKPLLGAALSGVVPARVLARRTKGDYAAEDYVGARAAASWLRMLLHDSRLAALGVIEPAAVADAIDRMIAGLAVPLGPLSTLLATEEWLRDRDGEPDHYRPRRWEARREQETPHEQEVGRC
ncbi:MAG: asparagine synthase-related protein [Trebonia sp.]